MITGPVCMRGIVIYPNTILIKESLEDTELDIATKRNRIGLSSAAAKYSYIKIFY